MRLAHALRRLNYGFGLLRFWLAVVVLRDVVFIGNVGCRVIALRRVTIFKLVLLLTGWRFLELG